MWSLPLGKLRWCFESFWQPKSSPERGGMWSLPLRRLRRCPRLMPACCGDPWLPLARLAAPWHAPWRVPSNSGQAPPQQPSHHKPSPHYPPSRSPPCGHPRTQTHSSPMPHTLSSTTPETPPAAPKLPPPAAPKSPHSAAQYFPIPAARRPSFSSIFQPVGAQQTIDDTPWPSASRRSAAGQRTQPREKTPP